MSKQKASRVDRLEKVVGEVIAALQNQGDAINFLLQKVQSLDPNEIEVNDAEEVKEEKKLEL